MIQGSKVYGTIPVDILVKFVVGGEANDGTIPDGEAEETLSDGCVPHLKAITLWMSPHVA